MIGTEEIRKLPRLPQENVHAQTSMYIRMLSKGHQLPALELPCADLLYITHTHTYTHTRVHIARKQREESS